MNSKYAPNHYYRPGAHATPASSATFETIVMHLGDVLGLSENTQMTRYLLHHHPSRQLTQVQAVQLAFGQALPHYKLRPRAVEEGKKVYKDHETFGALNAEEKNAAANAWDDLKDGWASTHKDKRKYGDETCQIITTLVEQVKEHFDVGPMDLFDSVNNAHNDPKTPAAQVLRAALGLRLARDPKAVADIIDEFLSKPADFLTTTARWNDKLEERTARGDRSLGSARSIHRSRQSYWAGRLPVWIARAEKELPHIPVENYDTLLAKPMSADANRPGRFELLRFIREESRKDGYPNWRQCFQYIQRTYDPQSGRASYARLDDAEIDTILWFFGQAGVCPDAIIMASDEVGCTYHRAEKLICTLGDGLAGEIKRVKESYPLAKPHLRDLVEEGNDDDDEDLREPAEVVAMVEQEDPMETDEDEESSDTDFVPEEDEEEDME